MLDKIVIFNYLRILIIRRVQLANTDTDTDSYRIPIVAIIRSWLTRKSNSEIDESLNAIAQLTFEIVEYLAAITSEAFKEDAPFV